MPASLASAACSLLQAITSLLALGHEAVCLLNADSPDLPTQFLINAAAALARPGDRMVPGMADDGGYYLTGLKHPHTAVFRDITWSGDQVSRHTLQRAAAVGLEAVLLPTWFDVDDVASCRRIVRRWQSTAGVRRAENSPSP